MASNATYVDALEVLAKQLVTMSMLADANLPFVMDLLQQVQAEARAPETRMQQAGILPAGDQNPVGVGAMNLPGGASMAAPPPSMAGAGVPPGVMPSGPPPSPDVLAALLG